MSPSTVNGRVSIFSCKFYNPTNIFATVNRILAFPVRTGNTLLSETKKKCHNRN
jgi:hypothetical protein